MCTARPAHLTISGMTQSLGYKQHLHNIDLGALNDVIHVDGRKQLARVEPGVRIGELNDHLIDLGWMLPVVPELDELTIGGLIMGGGIENTSHKYGFFQYICKAYEMIMPDGSLILCSEENHGDLFSAVPWSYGTLGMLTAVDMRIVPYKKYVHLRYKPVSSMEDMLSQLKKETHNKNDSVEAFLFSKEEGVLMTGNFVDKAEDDSVHVNHIGRWHKPWFYTHVQSFKENESEYIPTKDFFHRHNRSIFWLLHYLVPFGNHPIFRWLLGWTMPPKHSMLHRLRNAFCPPHRIQNFILQDFIMPFKSVRRCVELCDKEFNLYPVWLCPTRHLKPKRCEHHTVHAEEDVLVDIGVYGFTEVGVDQRGEKVFDRLGPQRRMERFTIENDGFVFLYAETALTKVEFARMFYTYNTIYEEVRSKYNCQEAFPHVYDKISTVGRNNFCVMKPKIAPRMSKKAA